MPTYQQKQQETIDRLEAQLTVAKEALNDIKDTTNICGSRGADEAISAINDDVKTAIAKINELETH